MENWGRLVRDDLQKEKILLQFKEHFYVDFDWTEVSNFLIHAKKLHNLCKIFHQKKNCNMINYLDSNQATANKPHKKQVAFGALLACNFVETQVLTRIPKKHNVCTMDF